MYMNKYALYIVHITHKTDDSCQGWRQACSNIHVYTCVSFWEHFFYCLWGMLGARCGEEKERTAVSTLQRCSKKYTSPQLPSPHTAVCPSSIYRSTIIHKVSNTNIQCTCRLYMYEITMTSYRVLVWVKQGFFQSVPFSILVAGAWRCGSLQSRCRMTIEVGEKTLFIFGRVLGVLHVYMAIHQEPHTRKSQQRGWCGAHTIPVGLQALPTQLSVNPLFIVMQKDC